MKKIILMVAVILSGSTTIAMQQPAAQKYSETASKKLMTALRRGTPYNQSQTINEVLKTLREGADPNYTEQHTFPTIQPIRGSLIPIELDEREEMERRYQLSGKTTSLTPLYQAINLRDRSVISILLRAGANPDLRNILDLTSINAGINALKTAREIAQEKGVELTIIPTLKLQ